jgi:hypothetical protein
MPASSPAATGKRYIRMLVRTRNAWAWWPGRSSKPTPTLTNRIPIAFFDGDSHPLDCHKLTYILSLSLPVS